MGAREHKIIYFQMEQNNFLKYNKILFMRLATFELVQIVVISFSFSLGVKVEKPLACQLHVITSRSTKTLYALFLL